MRFCGPECQKGGWRRHRAACSTAVAVKAQLCGAKYVRVYPNVGAELGEIEVEISRELPEREIWQVWGHVQWRQQAEVLAQVVFRDDRAVRLFAGGREVSSGQFWDRARKGVVVAAQPHGLRGPGASGPTHGAKPRWASRAHQRSAAGTTRAWWVPPCRGCGPRTRRSRAS